MTDDAAAPAKTQARQYIVLRQVDDGWLLVGTSLGTSDRQAIASLVDELKPSDQQGVFVAVPSRSWRPVKRAVQTIERTLWS